jgi:FkbM family methyltransferase
MLSKFINALPEIHDKHARSTHIYGLLEEVSGEIIKASRLRFVDDATISVGGFGEIFFPYRKMGAIDTLDLFGLDELIIFSFYWINRKRYKNAADIGANLGLHSILMSRCGWQVNSYEPDPIHADLLRSNLKRNNVKCVELFEAAVSDKPGVLEFIRVLGNTTGSHLAGAKTNPYGELERFPVKVLPIDSVMSTADFVKLDAEGQEKIIILATTTSHWKNTDMMVEVGSEENALAIYDHLTLLGVNLFSQKQGWKRVTSVDGMPKNYKEGSLFISSKSDMPWEASI